MSCGAVSCGYADRLAMASTAAVVPLLVADLKEPLRDAASPSNAARLSERPVRETQYTSSLCRYEATEAASRVPSYELMSMSVNTAERKEHHHVVSSAMFTSRNCLRSVTYRGQMNKEMFNNLLFL